MNAYEVADEIDGMAKAAEVQTTQSHAEWHRNIANMLRQQADRIAELEKFNKAILKKGGYPHKPLSNEEIWEVWQEAKKTALSTGNSNPIEVVFARAIEERHGIK